MVKPFFVRAVLFDMDGTLVDSTPVVEKVWSRWAVRHGFTPSDVTDFAHGRPTADVVRNFLPNVDAVAEAAALLAEEELDPTPINSIPGALAAVRIANQHARWAVVTSASRTLAFLRLKLGGFPEPPLLISADDIRRGKPDPEGFRKAAKLLNVPPEECLVLEDTPAGLEAGRAAGARIVGLTTTFPASALPAEVVLRDLTYLTLEPAPATGLYVSVRALDAAIVE
jgi:sugar-phosphatase